MAAVKPTVTLLQGPVQEFQPSAAQTAALATSCMASALARLTPEAKTGLITALDAIKMQVSDSLDALYARKSLIGAQVDLLSAQQAQLTTDNKAFSDFYRLMTPAIEACQDAQDLTSSTHAAIQPSVRVAVELNYQLLLATTQQDLVVDQINQTQATLNYLNRVEYLVS